MEGLLQSICPLFKLLHTTFCNQRDSLPAFYVAMSVPTGSYTSLLSKFGVIPLECNLPSCKRFICSLFYTHRELLTRHTYLWSPIWMEVDFDFLTAIYLICFSTGKLLLDTFGSNLYFKCTSTQRVCFFILALEGFFHPLWSFTDIFSGINSTKKKHLSEIHKWRYKRYVGFSFSLRGVI